jgi:hypothetical protein
MNYLLLTSRPPEIVPLLVLGPSYTEEIKNDKTKLWTSIGWAEDEPDEYESVVQF